MASTHIRAHTRTCQIHDPNDKREHYRLALARGMNIEAKEHPTLTLTQAMTIAKDHLKKNPHAYDTNWRAQGFREGLTD
jgi:hypothetical protein